MRTWIVILIMVWAGCWENPTWSGPQRTARVDDVEPDPEPVIHERKRPDKPQPNLVDLERQSQCEQATAAIAAGATPTARLAAALAVPDTCGEKARAAVAKVCDVREFDCDRACRSEQFEAGLRKLACAAAKLQPTATNLRYGDRVSAQWTNGYWYPGRVTAVYSDDTADVAYDDGDRSKGLPFTKVKLVKRPLFEKTQTAAPKALVEGASCAGPGWQYVCGGRCTDVKTDSNHCGACGHRCDDGYTCDGSGTCRTPSGGL